jgi:hypothetical protein
MARRDPVAALRRKVSTLKRQRRYAWVDRFELAPITDGFDDHGVDVQVVVRSGETDVFENAERLDALAASIRSIFHDSEAELYPYVTFVSADELAA